MLSCSQSFEHDFGLHVDRKDDKNSSDVRAMKQGVEIVVRLLIRVNVGRTREFEGRLRCDGEAHGGSMGAGVDGSEGCSVAQRSDGR